MSLLDQFRRPDRNGTTPHNLEQRDRKLPEESPEELCVAVAEELEPDEQGKEAAA